ncbi:MAG: C25 family cysteine peptidase [candidate division WOR-3 bacterium]
MKKVFISILILVGISYIIAENTKYLIITHNNFYDAVKPLAQWKHKKGLATTIVRVPSGMSPSSIKDTIIKYQAPYVLLVGEQSFIPLGKYFPSWSLYYPNCGTWTDQWYADTTNDSEYKNDIYLGRLPCSTAVQCSIIVNKILAYEQCRVKNSDWFIKATGVARDVRENNSLYDSCYITAINTIAGLLYAHGFNQVDKLFVSEGADSTAVEDSVEKGRGFLVYRGSTLSTTDNWNNPFAVNPLRINNDSMPTVVFSPTCRTMFFPDSLPTYPEPQTAAGNRWVRKSGNVSIPKGSSAFFGTTTHYHAGFAKEQTFWRNAASIAFFKAITQDSEYILGKAARKAQDAALSCCSLFTLGYPKHATACSVAYMEWNLLGDPEMHLWTALPKTLTVTHDTIINTGSQTFTVTITKDGYPLNNVLVCLTMDSTIYVTNYTNGEGRATFSISPQNVGLMSVTATTCNCKPYEGNVHVITGHDVCVHEILAPIGTITSGTNVVPKAVVQNLGGANEIFPVIFKIGNVYTDSIVISLAKGEIDTISFTNWIASTGNYQTKCYTMLIGDIDSSNNTKFGTLTVAYHDIAISLITQPEDTIISDRQLLPTMIINNNGMYTGPEICTVDVRIWRYRINLDSFCQISLNPSDSVLVYENSIVSLLNPGSNNVSLQAWNPEWSDIHWINEPTFHLIKVLAKKGNDQNLGNNSLQKVFTVKACYFDVQTNYVGFLYGASVVSNETLVYGRTYTPVLVASNSTFGPNAQIRTKVKITRIKNNKSIYNKSTDQTLNPRTYVCIVFPNLTPTDSGWFKMTSWIEMRRGVDSIITNNIIEQFLYVQRVKSGNNTQSEPYYLTDAFALNQNFPNPFKRLTNISWQIPIKSDVKISIFDATGRCIKTLINETAEPGSYNTIWDCRDEQGDKISDGIYFYEIRAGNFVAKRKMVIVR